MHQVAFIVPVPLEATLRFVRAAASLKNVRLAVISQQAASALPDDLQRAIGAHERVRDALDPEQLTRAVDKLGQSMGGDIDRVVGILEQLQEPMAEVRQRRKIRGMALQTARNFRDKAQMKEVLRQNGLPCARHQLCDSVEAALVFAKSCGFPLVVKPPAGAGAHNTFRVDDEAELRRSLDTMRLGPKSRVLLEEFIVGREFSFDSVSLGGRHVFHSINDYHPNPLEVMSQPWIQWCVLLPRDIDGPDYEAIREAGPRALQSLGMVTGMSHMEWFQRPDGAIAISEVAARPPGAQFTSLLSYAHDTDFYQAWARLMIDETFEPPERRYAVGAAFLRGQGMGRVVKVHGLEEARRELAELVVEAKLPRPGQARASSYEGEGYVILRHRDTEVVKRGLARVVKLLRVELG